MVRHPEAHVLLVEDNPADARLFRLGLSLSAARYRLTVIDDGEEAVHFLFRRGLHAGAPAPDLTLLDLNLPKRSGLDILKELKSHPDLKPIPVVVLTSSATRRDINAAYQYGANMYLLKPCSLEEIEQLMQMIGATWLTAVSLPSRPGEF